MSSIFLRRAAAHLFLVLMFLGFASRGLGQYTNGIYAEFNTSMGSYTCALYYAQAPKAVANFIGLATGQRAWLDLPSGLAKTNTFYDGLTFHRVITNFVIQAGSPNGLGTDGPGYAFVDEITNSLQFNKYGVLAMANSGPDSNGSQFFILATNTWPSLNNGYTIFGQLFGGSNVVHAINLVPADANGKPLTNVYINTVNIRRVGTAANAFDINAQGLPLITNLNLRIGQVGTNVSLVFSNRLYADNRLYASSNLLEWAANELGIETASPVSNTNFQPILAPAEFFLAAQVQYASSTFAPKALFGKTLTMFYTSGVIATNVIVFDNAGGGTYTMSGFTPGTVITYYWNQLPYNGYIPLIIYSGTLAPMALKLNFKTATSGNLTGTAYPNYPYTFGAFGFSGTFTSTP
jgi:cyclophilin family peptidyl-prolyl cis-trans isomerase